MAKFDRKKRDTITTVTLKNGDVYVIRQCKIVSVKTEEGVILYFHSNSINKDAHAFKVEDIATIEDDGKYIHPIGYTLGILGGGCAGAVSYLILKDIIVGNLKNPILNKIVPVVVIGGVVYVTATTVAEVMSWESINFFDDTEFMFKGVGKKIVNFFKKPKKGKEDNSGNEEEENK